MNPPAQNLIFTTAGIALRGDLVAHAEEKTAKLRRHLHPHIGLVRVHLKHETPHSSAPYFAVRANAETAGPDFVTHARASEPITAINLTFDKLERLATAVAQARQHRERRAASLEAS